MNEERICLAEKIRKRFEEVHKCINKVPNCNMSILSWSDGEYRVFKCGCGKIHREETSHDCEVSWRDINTNKKLKCRDKVPNRYMYLLKEWDIEDDEGVVKHWKEYDCECGITHKQISWWEENW